MKKLLTTAIISGLLLAATPAAALTIKNKCKYTVAGSVTIAKNMVSVAQFNISPGQSKQMLEDFEKMDLIIRTIPNVYDMEKLKINSIVIDTPDSHIELKQSPEGIKFKVQ
jgi:hypothetical protein